MTASLAIPETGPGLDFRLWKELHLEGLKRVSTVVNGNTNYDKLLEFRLSGEDLDAYRPGVSLQSKRDQGCAHIRKHLLRKPHKVILPQFSGFVCEGTTANNDREYSFFERTCSSLRIDIQHQNYSNCARVSIGKLSKNENSLLRAVLESAELYYQSCDDISAGLVRQLTLMSVSFYRFVVSFHRRGAVIPNVLVQANDHSPVRVAIAMVMKGLGVPRIYLQHAEVTPNFPPLDFEYSVLRNARSKGVYEALGPNAGHVFVLPRDSEPFASERLAAEQTPPVTVVIYPTSRVIVDELKRLISQLKANDEIGKIIIKQHPAAAHQLEEVFSNDQIHFSVALPKEPHIALVGNSAVATELLHYGVPVYQNFDLDPVERDYYGFVASGLTKEVTQAELTGRFWAPYNLDAKWLGAFKQLDPTVDTAYEADKDRFLAAMQALKATVAPTRTARRMRGSTKARVKAMIKRSLVTLINASPAISAPVLDVALSTSARLGNFLTLSSHLGANYLRNRTNITVKSARWRGDKASTRSRLGPSNVVIFIEKTLRDLSDPAAWIVENERLGVFSDHLVISALENLFQDRQPKLNEIFEGASLWRDGSTVDAWIYLKRADWGRIALDTTELDQLSAYIHGLGAEHVAKPLLERFLLSALIRCGTCAQLDTFWANSANVSLETIATNTRISLLQKLYSEPARMQQAVEFRQRFEISSSSYELLKLRNMDYLSGQSSPNWNHAVAERQFEELSPNGVAQEFRDVALPFYEQFRHKMVLMEARTETWQSRSALQQIRSALEQRTPFSFVRLSDGEGYLFPGYAYFTQEDASNRERHWWGTELPLELAERIITEARQAVASADIVGIPAVYRFIRDTSDTSRRLSQSLQGRGLLQVLAGAPSLLAEYAQLSEDKINVSLFSNLNTVVDLVAITHRTYIVGSVKPEHLPEQLTSLTNVSTVVIPTHAKTTLNDRYERNALALPFVYEQVLDQLDAVQPGDLVLVAGGIVGKIMLGHARARGAVALDIGSVLDDWVSGDQKSLR